MIIIQNSSPASEGPRRPPRRSAYQRIVKGAAMLALATTVFLFVEAPTAAYADPNPGCGYPCTYDCPDCYPSSR